MSREIKFRGLRTDGKGWVIGGVVYGKSGNVYIFQGNDIEIVEDDCLEVIPSSVGQFTGLTDKNGKEIYEGDVLKIQTYNMTVKFTEGCFYAINENNSVRVTFSSSVVKIIGNIHEKGGKNEKH